MQNAVLDNTRPSILDHHRTIIDNSENDMLYHKASKIVNIDTETEYKKLIEEGCFINMEDGNINPFNITK